MLVVGRILPLGVDILAVCCWRALLVVVDADVAVFTEKVLTGVAGVNVELGVFVDVLVDVDVLFVPLPISPAVTDIGPV